jgi:glucose-6-phosphate-specific signal transduction histidine kinase
MLPRLLWNFERLQLQLVQVVVTIVFFAAALVVNSWLFQAWLEHAPGIAWVYLPAGVRLLCTLLFAAAGAVGLLIVSWLVSFFVFFPDDPQRAFLGGIIGALAPWTAYLFARHVWGLQSSLANLNGRNLLTMSVLYALLNPLMHHVYFALRGQDELIEGFIAMFVGDLLGTLLVLYATKAVLGRQRVRAGPSSLDRDS